MANTSEHLKDRIRVAEQALRDAHGTLGEAPAQQRVLWLHDFYSTAIEKERGEKMFELKPDVAETNPATVMVFNNLVSDEDEDKELLLSDRAAGRMETIVEREITRLRKEGLNPKAIDRIMDRAFEFLMNHLNEEGGS